MGGKTGFWFYPGDWTKDPELRFCSLFARGLLVELLCLMFEAKRQGYLCKPDGSARSIDEIAVSITGASPDEVRAGVEELLTNGVLKREERTGIIFSSRLAKLSELSKVRSNAGSKGGSKKASNRVATDVAKDQQATKQKGGVSASDSDSDYEYISPSLLVDTSSLKEGFLRAFDRWLEFRFREDGKRVNELRQSEILSKLLSRGQDKSIVDIAFSIEVGAKNIQDATNDFRKRNDGATI